MSIASAYLIPFFTIRDAIGSPFPVEAQIRVDDDASLEIAYQAIEKKMLGTMGRKHWSIILNGMPHSLAVPLFVYEPTRRRYVRRFSTYNGCRARLALQSGV